MVNQSLHTGGKQYLGQWSLPCSMRAPMENQKELQRLKSYLTTRSYR